MRDLDAVFNQRPADAKVPRNFPRISSFKHEAAQASKRHQGRRANSVSRFFIRLTYPLYAGYSGFATLEPTVLPRR